MAAVVETYSVTQIVVPGAGFTRALGINNNGDIVGQYRVVGTPSGSQLNGFIDINGVITTFIEPDAVNFFGLNGPITDPTGINDLDQVVGTYFDGMNLGHGFVYSGGVYSAINFPGAAQTGAQGINNAGDIVGSYTDAHFITHGYLYSAGVFTEIDVPGATQTSASGINNFGEIVGSYISSAGSGVFADIGGSFTTYTLPGTSYGGLSPPYPQVGVNDAGEIVSGNFTWLNGVSTALNVTNFGGGTGINNSGEIVGSTNGGFGAGLLLSVACYVHGTCIATPHGEVAVETLVAGDQVLTASGTARSVRWVGHRRINTTTHPDPMQIWPVRVQAGAFPDSLQLRDLWASRGHTQVLDRMLPHRDLYLSPDHAVFLDGVLIPIRYLVNGLTIRQEPRDQVTYWHVELDRHDVLLAEGLPCESFLDTGNRSAFDNGGVSVQLHADFGRRADYDYLMWETFACAPLVVAGDEVKSARERLRAQAALLGLPPSITAFEHRAQA